MKWHRNSRNSKDPATVARFPDNVPPEAAAALRQLGFRWNRLPDQWEGKIVLAEARPIVDANGGVIAPAKPD